MEPFEVKSAVCQNVFYIDREKNVLFDLFHDVRKSFSAKWILLLFLIRDLKSAAAIHAVL